MLVKTDSRFNYNCSLFHVFGRACFVDSKLAYCVLVILVIFLQAAILYGGNEELRWRVTLLPILEKGTPAPIATLVVSIVWIIWHISLWLIESNSH